VAFGVGLGEVAGKVFRIGHLGSLTDAYTEVAKRLGVLPKGATPIRPTLIN
jgi:aspartate aminotransferase-like enzyme